MDPNPSSKWSSIVKKDPPSKRRTTDGAPEAILGTVGNCRSRKGISMAVVDANAVIAGSQSLTNFPDKFVTVSEVKSEIRDTVARRLLDFIFPFTIETMKPSSESLSKVIEFARATGDLQALSHVDIKLIALTYTLEAQVHGTKNLRDIPPPIQAVRVNRLPEKELPGWGSNVANLEEWEALENETEEKSNLTSKIIPLKDLNMNILPSDNCSEVASVVSQAEDEQEGERKQRRYPPKKMEVKLEGKMVVEGIDASQGEYNDEDTGDWRPVVSRSTQRRRKANRERYNVLAEKEIQRDLEAEKAGNLTQDTTDQMSKDDDEKCAKDTDEELSSILIKGTRDSLKALQEGPEETNAETTLSNGEDDIEVEADVASEASSMADDIGRSEQSWSLSESSVACITGDYAMQNVILQMGLRLLAPAGGMQIRQLKRWILQCHACYTTVPPPNIPKCDFFCPKCGNPGTLCRVEATIDKNGTIIAACRPRIFSVRGTKFPIPMPKSGRDAIKKNLVLREDQLPQKYLHPKTKKKASKPGDEYFISDDVFMNHHSDRKAPLQPPVGKTMAIFSQKRNPNDNHYSRSMF